MELLHVAPSILLRICNLVSFLVDKTHVHIFISTFVVEPNYARGDLVGLPLTLLNALVVSNEG